MPKITITVGLPASGKSTWAKEQVAKSHGKIKRVNKDDLRALLDAGTWSRDREKFTLKIRDLIITEAMCKHLDIIVDDTNLAPKHINHIKQMVENWNIVVDRMEADESIPKESIHPKYTVEVNDSFLEVPYKLCVKRDLARPNSVGEKVIRQMYIQFVLKVEKLKQDESLPHVVICDLDGNLCLFGKKNPYERDFENDKINEAVALVLNDYQMLQYEEWGSDYPKIVFLSGRNSKYGAVTREWISKNLPMLEPEQWELHMRKEGDSRSDVIVKRELFDEHVRDKYYIDFVMDDRKSVKSLWVSMGLFVFDTNQFDEEF